MLHNKEIKCSQVLEHVKNVTCNKWGFKMQNYSIIIQYIIVLRKFYLRYITKKEKCSQAIEHVNTRKLERVNCNKCRFKMQNYVLTK